MIISLLLLAGCRGSLSPLSNRLKIGEEPYVVFTADGEDGRGDLFASPPEGGKAFQVTFTRVDERAPALSPDGSILAFLRGRSVADSNSSLVLLNLLNGAERQTPAPAGTTAIAWSGDGTTLLVETGAGLQRSGVPPRPLALEPVPATDRSRADSLFRVVLGDPPVGVAGPCASGAGVCARLANGDSLRLSASGSGATRWSSDSLAYREDGGFVIRPLAGGRTRIIRWKDEIRNPRELTRFPGVKRATPQE
jgi:WD40-like Beta Propeller Repeat